MDRSVTMRVPVGTTNLSGMTCETELIVRVSREEPIAEKRWPCNCPYCRAYASVAQPRNMSPLAAIDVFSQPDEPDVRGDTGAPAH